ncbi:hypothetical protein Acor_01650 [Acrocarpospora corrugata]|uniref:Uncharacterized protein n=1 Tax=Acrocarpospora corrugata TaxID=35763 RepID=A0A5M3VNL1_9ACTN|nr:hypothetical protein [Acrocarpospora corrugata]GER98103.1 hypothetical protein Acor_01650 [Acrocarpospora corrugata]
MTDEKGETMFEVAMRAMADGSLDDVPDDRPYVRGVIVRWLPEFDLVLRRIEAAASAEGPGTFVSLASYIRVVAEDLFQAIEDDDIRRIEIISSLLLELLSSSISFVTEVVEEGVLEGLAHYYSDISDMLPLGLRREVESRLVRFGGPEPRVS